MSQTYIKYLQGLLNESKINFLDQKQFKYQERKQSLKDQPPINNNKLIDTNMQSQLQGKLVERYCRQMLLKQISYDGQLKIINTKVALIGSGGIGCPVALYLAGAGVGTIGLFDSDTVDMTNLHRQVAHKNSSVGVKKTQSLKNTLLQFNPNIKINQHEFITVQTAKQLDQYDLVIDGSDNPECRYIVNDYCMKIGKKLLSGACIGWEGQITCYGGENAPCYRCIWGNQQKTTGGCSTLGVVGMIPGFVGIILAIEAIKLILNEQSSLQGHLLTYESKTSTFRKMKLRNKNPQCIGCGVNKLDMRSYDYSIHAICKPNMQNLPIVDQMNWQQFLKTSKQKKILDVRPSNQFNICHLKNMQNIPYEKLSQLSLQQVVLQLQSRGILNTSENGQKQRKKQTFVQQKIFISCNRGVMSKRAADFLSKLGLKSTSIIGGITQYSKNYDSSIPLL